MALTISHTCAGIAPSVTLKLNAQVADMKRQGIDVLNLGAGEPDFDTPAHILDAAEAAMRSGKTRYTAVSGIPELRAALSEKVTRETGVSYTPDQVIVCNGAKQALVNALCAILDPGDEVILPLPCWVSYPEMVRMAGGVPVTVASTLEQGFVPSAEQLRRAVTPRTKAIILNSPNNPTGAVWRRDQLQAAADLAREYDFFIISDEIYDKLIFDGAEHVTVPSLSSDAAERTILVNGFSKSYAMTGWRLGYAVGPRPVIAAMSAYQSHATGNPCSVAQYAGLAALTGDQSCVSDMVQAFARRRDVLVACAREIDGVTFFDPKGAFYLLLNISPAIGRRYHGQMIENSLDFAQLLLTHQHVSIIPGDAFGAKNCCRISYTRSEDVIREAMARIRSFINELD